MRLDKRLNQQNREHEVHSGLTEGNTLGSMCSKINMDKRRPSSPPPAPKPRKIRCNICNQLCRKDTAHRHQSNWIGDACCWDDRLKSSE